MYEEQSLGVFQDDEDSDEEDEFQPTGSRVTVWSRYLAMHARRQLAFGIDIYTLLIVVFTLTEISRYVVVGISFIPSLHYRG